MTNLEFRKLTIAVLEIFVNELDSLCSKTDTRDDSMAGFNTHLVDARDILSKMRDGSDLVE